MERESLLKTSKFMSLVVMLLTGLIILVQSFGDFWSKESYSQVIIALGVFLVALRGYLKDNYGVL